MFYFKPKQEHNKKSCLTPVFSFNNNVIITLMRRGRKIGSNSGEPAPMQRGRHPANRDTG